MLMEQQPTKEVLSYTLQEYDFQLLSAPPEKYHNPSRSEIV